MGAPLNKPAPASRSARFRRRREHVVFKLIDAICTNHVDAPLDEQPRALRIVHRVGQHPQAEGGAERMITFVAAYVDQVDLPGRRITVDWSADWD